MYPLKFYPIYKERIWGGSALAEKFGRELPYPKTGESWDVSCHPNGTSVIANGPWVGKPLSEIVQHYGRQLLGTALREDSVRKFPLLMKLIDAADNLSVQVHPDDDYAGQHEGGELGKAELWYIIKAKPGAKIVYGLTPGTSREEFKAALDAGDADRLLNWVEVKEGEVYDIPAGLTHALGAGVMVAEIQQNSDTTYRVYDYNRLDDSGKPRDLHVSKALDVIKFTADVTQTGPASGFVLMSTDSYTRRLVAANKYFATELIDLRDVADNGSVYAEVAGGSRFLILTAVRGGCLITHQAGVTSLAPGDSCFIPALVGRFQVEVAAGHEGCRLMKSFVPDLEMDIVRPLTEAGYDRDVAKSLIRGL